MILGTHNTMTYRKPKVWYVRPFGFMAKCQAVDYKEQHEKYGVNAIDIRIFWDSKGNIEFRHGVIAYDGSDLYDVLDYCNKENMIIRILFEERNNYLKKRTERLNLKEKFINLCKEIEEKYPNITFYGGRNTKTSEQLYDFKNQVNDIGYYSSETSLFEGHSKSSFWGMLDDLWPYLYARLKNKENKCNAMKTYETQNVILHFDFINIG